MEAALAVGISVTVIMLSALIFDRLKLPNILGVLVAGILMGPYSPLLGAELFGLHFSNIIIADPSLVEVFAIIGSALILFGIGLEFSIIRIAQLGLFSILGALVKIGSVYLASYIALTIFGFPPQASAIVAIALSFSSTPIIIKLLDSTGRIRRPEVPFIISILIIEDLLIVFFLGLLSHPQIGQTEYSFAFSLVRIVLTFIFAYFILSRMINQFLKMVSHSDELLILSTVGLVLIIGYLSEGIGLSFSVGAFLAGSTIAGSVHSRKIEEHIRPFNALFASFFFFSIGLAVDISTVISNFPLLLLFILIGLWNFVSSGAASYFVGFNGRSASFCASTLLPRSELSLLLITQGIAIGLVAPDFLGIFAFAIIASAFLSTWLIGRENEIYNGIISLSPQILVKNMRLMRATALGMRRAFSDSAKYYNIVERLPSISYRTDQFSAREQLVLTSKNAGILGTVSGAAFAALFFSQQPSFSFLESFFIFIFGAYVVSSALFLVNAASAASSLLAMMSRSSSRYYPIGHFLTGLFFIMMCWLYFSAHALAPSSLSVLLIIPSGAFALRSLYSAFRTLSLGVGRL